MFFFARINLTIPLILYTRLVTKPLFSSESIAVSTFERLFIYNINSKFGLNKKLRKCDELRYFIKLNSKFYTSRRRIMSDLCGQQL